VVLVTVKEAASGRRAKGSLVLMASFLSGRAVGRGREATGTGHAASRSGTAVALRGSNGSTIAPIIDYLLDRLC